MAKKYKTLVMGASYGSLLGTKLAMAGHDTVLVCLPAEVEKINADGALVKIPVRGREGLVEINSRKLPGKVSAAGPASTSRTRSLRTSSSARLRLTATIRKRAEVSPCRPLMRTR